MRAAKLVPLVGECVLRLLSVSPKLHSLSETDLDSWKVLGRLCEFRLDNCGVFKPCLVNERIPEKNPSQSVLGNQRLKLLFPCLLGFLHLRL